MSRDPSRSRPLTCSGDMYGNVPDDRPLPVIASAFVTVIASYPPSTKSRQARSPSASPRRRHMMFFHPFFRSRAQSTPHDSPCPRSRNLCPILKPCSTSGPPSRSRSRQRLNLPRTPSPCSRSRPGGQYHSVRRCWDDSTGYFFAFSLESLSAPGDQRATADRILMATFYPAACLATVDLTHPAPTERRRAS